jgi:uncharacterized membrane protein YgcG
VILNRSVLFCTALLVNLSLLAVGQTPQPYLQQQPEPQPANAPRLSPQDLSNLVAPIALYPDLLLSQILAASTYPAEITEAQQWMQRNPGLRGQQLVEAAKQQPWDPSVQALVAFPDVMNTLTRDMQWTTDLGNAFLSQQADVMDAIQRLRASARDNGRLTNTPQQRVTYDQNAIVIQPVDPQTVYVPVYNPEYVWGPPAYGYYPPLGYPGVGYGIGFGVGTFLGGFFSGLVGFGGWGWGFSWLSHGLFLNGLFFNHFGFHGYGGYGFHGGYGYASRAAWVHNPGHRMGVPYSGHYAGAHFAGSGSRGYASARSYNAGRSAYAGNSRQAEAYRGLSAGAARGNSGYSQPHYSARGNSAPASRYSGAAPRGTGSSGHGWAAPASHSRSSTGHYAAPKSSGHARGPSGNSGGHSGGHGHSGGGGGRSHGGGSHKK